MYRAPIQFRVIPLFRFCFDGMTDNRSSGKKRIGSDNLHLCRLVFIAIGIKVGVFYVIFLACIGIQNTKRYRIGGFYSFLIQV